MYYNIRHVTRFRYSAPISESIMEVRIQPRSENNQHCLDFRLHTSPRAHIMSYRGEFGNRVHHFDVPNYHSQLTITAAALVDVSPPDEIPMALDTHAWEEIDQLTADDEYWDFLKPSRFAAPSDLLYAFMREHNIQRRDDPLTVLRDLNTTIYQTFEYMPKATRVDSPIDDALRLRRGVCQDFAHIMITLVRQLGIPSRYVSGYLFHQSHNRASASSDATHAWVEALLPNLGWIGFDPTNNTLANERHIRVAIGRDYADVPPTRGIFRGKAESELSVTVRVTPADVPPDADLLAESEWQPSPLSGYDPATGQQQQPQQQQQA
jgi:transglutaminase-like putative cysteine protease